MTVAVIPRSVAGEVTLYIGDVHAGVGPVVIKTLLGSCIAVCLWDPATTVGGMNHFMLPRGAGHAGPADSGDPGRFGIYAMDCLIGAIQKLGGERRRLVAKVFGGAHVLGIRESADGVPQKNIDFIRAFLRDEGIPVAGQDVGGYHARHVHFHTATGRAFVKRLAGEAAASRVLRREVQTARRVPACGDVTLFE